MTHTFRDFLNTYIDAWKNSSITQMRGLISEQYKAREITNGEIIDFGFEESIKGWEQGFQFVIQNKASWLLNEHAVLPLREDEVLVIISASMMIEGRKLETANLFFQTFKKNDHNNWELVRSYIEAGIKTESISNQRLGLK